MSNTDIIREVDEELRREQLEKLWKKHGGTMLVVALIIVVGVGGYQLWQYWRQQQAEREGARFVAAMELQQAGKTDEAEKALTAILGDGSAAYRTLAGLRLAALLASTGKAADAVAAYDAVAKDASTDRHLRSFAALQAATIRVDTADWTEMQNRLNELVKDDSAWRYSARELLGLAAYKAGNLEEAEKQYQSLMGERSVPNGVLKRAQMMLEVILSASAKPA